MNRKQRRIFYSCLILLFLMITPLILLYATGYNFRLFERKIVKTGLMIVNSFPSGGDIYLNGQLTKKRTPARLPNLIPGEYSIEIKKAGFKPWQKKLNVYAHYTTFADQIVLFKNKPRAKLIIEKNILFAKASPDKREIAILTKTGQTQSLQIINPLKNTERIIKAEIKENIEDISWEKNYIFLKLMEANKFDWIIFDLSRQSETQVSTFTIQSFEKLRAGNLNLFYGLSEHVIYQIDLSNQKIQTLSQQRALDFGIKNNYLYYFTDRRQKTEMVKIDLLKNTEIALNNMSDSYKLFLDVSLENYFFLSNDQSSCLYNIEREKKEICFPHEIKEAILSPDREKILFFNDSEIFVYYLLKNEENLITRQGKNIKKVVWYPNSQYLIYNTDESLNVMEIDKRDKINNYLLFEGEAKIISLPSTKNLTLIKKDQDSNLSLYTLNIQ